MKEYVPFAKSVKLYFHRPSACCAMEKLAGDSPGMETSARTLFTCDVGSVTFAVRVTFLPKPCACGEALTTMLAGSCTTMSVATASPGMLP